MLSRRLGTACLALLLAVLLGGCMASQNPVGPLSEAVNDERLLGSWRSDKTGETEFVHVLRRNGASDLAMEIVVANQENGWLVFRGHVTTVGDGRYISAKLVTADDGTLEEVGKSPVKDSHPYSFAAYKLEGDDTLIVATPIEAVHTAVAEGRLAGKTEGEYDVYVTDSSANIAAFLGGLDDAKLFTDPVRYSRVKSAVP